MKIRLLIYLDFDGVLHPDVVYRPRNKPLELRAEGALLMHAPVLERLLEPYGDTRIVLSTSWVRELGYERTIKKIKQLLPDTALVDRIVGATWHHGMRNGGYDPFSDWTRFDQIHAHTKRHGIKNWLAIDDLHSGDEDWPEDMSHHLVLTDPKMGLGCLNAQEELKEKLKILLAQESH